MSSDETSRFSSSSSDATTDPQSTTSPAEYDNTAAEEAHGASQYDSSGYDREHHNPNVPQTESGSPETDEGPPSSDEYSDEGICFDTTPVPPPAQNQAALAMTGMQTEQSEEVDPAGEDPREDESEEEEMFLMSGGLGYRDEGDEESRPLLSPIPGPRDV